MNVRDFAAAAALALLIAGCASQTPKDNGEAKQVVAADIQTAEAPVQSAAASPVAVAPGVDSMPAKVAPTAKPDSAKTETSAATDAEADYEALYGTATVDGSAQATGVPVTQVRDPWEKYNRKVHDFNNAIDRAVLRPVAKFYMKVVPKPVRTVIGNFFRNLTQPITVLNAALQGKPEVAANALMRFAVNSTFGIGGLLDPASALDIPTEQEDFGQTLGRWGWKNSRYVELPMFGPRTVRDVVGMVVDRPLNPTRRFDPESQAGMGVLQVVNIRTQLLSIDSLREGASDDYMLYRDSWMQRRNFQIFGDDSDGGESVPSYLLTAPVPMAEMPTEAKPKKESRWKFWKKKKQ